MLLYYIRHADPIYNPDSITEYGKLQAKSLANRLVKEAIDEVYSSSCGRALMTAEATCKKLGLECKPLDFAREDKVWADMSLEVEGMHANWCFEFPHITKLFLDPAVIKLGDGWYNHELFANYKFKEGLKRIDKDVDEFFEKLGYIHDRKNKEYKVMKSNDKKIAFFAHSGFGMAFLSSVLDIPYNIYSTYSCCMNINKMTIFIF